MSYRVLCFIMFIGLFQISISQTFSFDSIKVEGCNFFVTKSEIINALGYPKETYPSRHECGFLTSSENDRRETLVYSGLKFTGNAKEGYVFDVIVFKDSMSVKFNYANHVLSENTTQSDLIKIFGIEFESALKESPNDVVLINQGSDDGIRLNLERGKLVSIEYWSPC